MGNFFRDIFPFYCPHKGVFGLYQRNDRGTSLIVIQSNFFYLSLVNGDEMVPETWICCYNALDKSNIVVFDGNVYEITVERKRFFTISEIEVEAPGSVYE